MAMGSISTVLSHTLTQAFRQSQTGETLVKPRKAAGKTKHNPAQASRTSKTGETSASEGILCSRKRA